VRLASETRKRRNRCCCTIQDFSTRRSKHRQAGQEANPKTDQRLTQREGEREREREREREICTGKAKQSSNKHEREEPETETEPETEQQQDPKPNPKPNKKASRKKITWSGPTEASPSHGGPHPGRRHGRAGAARPRPALGDLRRGHQARRRVQGGDHGRRGGCCRRGRGRRCGTQRGGGECGVISDKEGGKS